MPIASTVIPAAGPHVVVQGSMAVELEWIMDGAERNDYRRDHLDLDELYLAHPGLDERVRSFWADADLSGAAVFPGGGFLELLILAQRGGLLLSLDGDALVSRMAELAGQEQREATFPSEPEEDQAVLHRRLQLLHDEPEVRQRYAALVRDVWDAARPVWDRYGRASTEAAVVARRAQLAEGASWVEVSEYDSACWAVVPGLVADLGQGGQLAVIPAFFTHLGLVFALPGLVVVGVRTDPTGAQARARTELVARRLKTMADPTRLAIIGTLANGPRTVTEIARLFDLSQPTVSTHVKLLKDAGLVAKVRRGSRQDLEVQRSAVDELVEHLRAVIGPPRTMAL